MTSSQKNLFYGIFIGLCLSIPIFLVKYTDAIDFGGPFLMGVLSCFAVMALILITLLLFFKDRFQSALFGSKVETETSETQNSTQEAINNIIGKYLPHVTEKDTAPLIKLAQNYFWGRAVHRTITIIFSVFLTIGAILGSILLLEQNKKIDIQNEKNSQ